MIRSLLLLILLAFIAESPEKNASPQWIKLFNGKDLSNWKIKIKDHPLGDNFANTFRVTDGNLTVGYEEYTDFNEQFGHIFYAKKYSSYLLTMEYRFIGDQAKGGPAWAYRNSGAMIHSPAPETMGLNQDFPISIEVQLLGGNGNEDRPTANLCTPGTNVMLNGKLFTDHCINSSSKTYHGDQWVRVDVLVLGDSIIRHIVEGDTVLVYSKPQIGGGAVSNYDPKEKVDGKPLKGGYISLQSESHPVQFRKVELFDLEPYVRDSQKLKSMIRKLSKRSVR
ncbi:MAG: DUF1080 domain-containing protein [Cyclobacteriaceae bacterium]|nr:DUF1080 domain-containing protein [Cyclobacteriaceae bacterium]MDH4295052.1 DUF1080 domain-containing protein [Cyclobacteriaceae bacterium]MDH5249783.1 DUF1080 domain-containing protein [Cyclobacteriaceae bacterium]